MLTNKQNGGSQGKSLGSSFGTSASNSNACSSNAQQASVGLENETSENAPATVAKAGAIVELNRSFQTSKPYYPKKDNDFKTWSNMKTQPDEDENESKDDKQVLTAEGETFQIGILAVQSSIGEQKIQDLIVDTGFAVYVVSSQFYETIINRGQF